MNQRYLYMSLAMLLTSLLVLWYSLTQVEPPVGVHVPATPAPELTREETIAVQVAEPIQVYTPSVKTKLKLSPAVQSDAKQHVVASTRTANDDRAHTVTTVLNTATGKFDSYDRAEPLPWLEVSTRRRFGTYIGALNGEQAIALTATQEALRIKGVRVEAVAIGVVSQSEQVGFVGVGLSW